MTQWSSEELDRIGTAEELVIEPMRHDGTLQKPVIIWVVRVGDEVYVRSVNGRTSGWFQAAQQRNAGRIQAGGVEKDVAFVEETDPAMNDVVSVAYRTKYHDQPVQWVDPMVVPLSEAATIKLVPRTAGS